MSQTAAPNIREIQDRIRTYLLETFLKGSRQTAIQEGTRLLGGDLLDSIGMLELSVHLEESYGITIAAEEVTPGNFGTVSLLAEFVRRKAEA